MVKKIHVMVLWVLTPCSDATDTNVSEDLAAFILTLKMEAARYTEMFISYHIITQCQNVEDHNSFKLSEIY